MNYLHRSCTGTNLHLACALRQDLSLLKDGDMTQVGEKGMFSCCLLAPVCSLQRSPDDQVSL